MTDRKKRTLHVIRDWTMAHDEDVEKRMKLTGEDVHTLPTYQLVAALIPLGLIIVLGIVAFLLLG